MNTNTLTQREREILGLASAGLTNQRIAEELGISRNAVRYHLKEIHSKLETGGERMSLVRHRWTKALGLFGIGIGAARAEIIGVAALAAIALGGVGVAAVTWDRTDGSGANGDMRAWRPCVGTDSGPCLLTVRSDSFAGYGMTLGDLAASYGTTEAELRALNPAAPAGVIEAGYDIIIPVPEGSGVGQVSATPAGR